MDAYKTPVLSESGLQRFQRSILTKRAQFQGFETGSISIIAISETKPLDKTRVVRNRPVTSRSYKI